MTLDLQSHRIGGGGADSATTAYGAYADQRRNLSVLNDANDAYLKNLTNGFTTPFLGGAAARGDQPLRAGAPIGASCDFLPT